MLEGEIKMNQETQTQSKLTIHPDVKAKVDSQKWFYTDTVKEHFFTPRNIFISEAEAQEYAKNCDGIGMVGSPACGDAMKMWIKVDKENDVIREVKWQTFGSLLPGAKILMKDYKTKPVEKLTIGDEIIDGDGKLNTIEETFARDYSGKVFTFRLSTSKYYKFEEEFVNGTEISTLPACQLQEGDFLVYNIPKENVDSSELSEDFCTLLGYYVSDGHAPSKSRTVFYFNLGEEEFIEEIANICNKYNWNYISYPRKNYAGLCIQINDPKVTQLL